MVNDKQNMTIEDVKELLFKEDVFSLLYKKQYGLFGSFARNETFHDIDILIEKPIDVFALYLFKERFRRKYKLKLDIMIKEYSDPIILRNALKDVIYVQPS